MPDPLLLLDVDKTLNPYQGDPAWLASRGYEAEDAVVATGDVKPVWLKRAHGAMLLVLAELCGLELAWASAWGERANEYIGPRLGLPVLPVVPVDVGGSDWKYPAVLEYAAGRPLAWLDDEFFTRGDRAGFLAARGDTPTLLQLVNPLVGVIQADLLMVARWAGAFE